jgi:putative aldouronate transport system substrate-binding protein
MKRTFTGRLWLLLVGLSLIAGSAFASGKPATATTGATPEISYMANFEFVPEATSETMMFKLWGEKVGVKINPVFILIEDQAVRIQTMLAAGDLPDLIRNHTPELATAHSQYGPQGVFASTSDLVAAGKMPYLAEVLKRIAPEGLAIAPDGKSYMTPNLRTFADAPFAGITVRKDYLQAGGWQGDLNNITGTVNTLADWDKVAAATYKAISAQQGAPTPIIINRREVNAERGWIGRTMALNTGTYIRMYYGDNNTYFFGPAHARYKPAVEWMANAYKQGWLHPNWVTMTEEEQVALYARDAYGMFFGPVGGNYGDRAAGKGPEYLANLVDQSVFLLPPVINGERSKHRQPPQVDQVGLYMITKNARTDAAAKALDFMYSNDGAELLQHGPEGYAWVKDPNPFWGRKWILNWSGRYPLDEVASDPSRVKTRSQGIGSGGTVPAMFPFDMWGKDNLIRYVDVTEPGIEVQFTAQQAVDIFKENGVWNNQAEPALVFTPDEDERRIELQGALYTYADEERVKFINGRRPLSEWNDYLAQLDRLGYKELENIYNAALARVRK